MHTSVQALENDIREWIATWNDNPRLFTLDQDPHEILSSLADYLAKLRARDHVTQQDFSLERLYRAPPGRVFAAWADPQAKVRWFAGHRQGQAQGGGERVYPVP